MTVCSAMIPDGVHCAPAAAAGDVAGDPAAAAASAVAKPEEALIV